MEEVTSAKRVLRSPSSADGTPLAKQGTCIVTLSVSRRSVDDFAQLLTDHVTYVVLGCLVPWNYAASMYHPNQRAEASPILHVQYLVNLLPRRYA